MKREDIRRENARALAETAGGLAAFARLTGMEPSQVSQLIGKKPSKNIGNMIAQRIERAFGLTDGQLDHHAVAEPRHPQAGLHEAPKVEAKESEQPRFQRHWLSPDEADHLAEYRSMTENGRKTLKIIARRMERERVDIGAVDES